MRPSTLGGIALAIRVEAAFLQRRLDPVDGRREVEVHRVLVEHQPLRTPALEQLDDARVRAPVGLDPQVLEALRGCEVVDAGADEGLQAGLDRGRQHVGAVGERLARQPGEVDPGR